MIFNLIEITILTVINAFSAFLIIVVLSNAAKEKLHLWLAVMTVCLTGWVDSSYIGYMQTGHSIAVAAYRANGVFVSGFVLAAYFFYIEYFLGIRNIIARWAIVLATVVFSVLNLGTNTIFQGITRHDWGNEIHFGSISPIFSVFNAGFSCVLIYLFVTKFSRLNKEEKNRARYFLIGTVLLVFFNIIFNVLLPILLNTARYQHYGDYSAAIFLVFTAYAMLKERFLNIRVATAAFLISTMMLLLIVDILALSHSLLEQGLKTVSLVFFVAISVLLVRGVLTEIRQREEIAKANLALEKSRQRYIDLATEQKDIIDVMGHEIRTPLTAIVQEIKIHNKYTMPIEQELLEEASHTVNLKKILPYLLDTVKTVDRASAHAVALVTDMLETARLDKGRFTLNYETFDLVGVVRDNVELMKKTVDGEDDSVTYSIKFVDPGFSDLVVEADKTRIGQAVYALLSNALKYRDPEKKDVRITVSLRKEAGRAIIEVKDNGLGIAKEDISKLGKKFMRLNPKTNGGTVRPGGTGLGLFVVKGIMDHHHGEMVVESEGMGHGSVFSLDFPVAKASDRQRAS